MERFLYKVNNALGIYYKPAGEISGCAKQFESDVHITKGTKRADGKHLLDIMKLDARQGEIIEVSVSGNDEKSAVAAITDVLNGSVG